MSCEIDIGQLLETSLKEQRVTNTSHDYIYIYIFLTVYKERTERKIRYEEVGELIFF